MCTRNIFRSVETREMRTDNFRGGVALQPTRAAVPSQDIANGIKRENRIVRHRVDEQSKYVLVVR